MKEVQISHGKVAYLWTVLAFGIYFADPVLFFFRAVTAGIMGFVTYGLTYYIFAHITGIKPKVWASALYFALWTLFLYEYSLGKAGNFTIFILSTMALASYCMGVVNTIVEKKRAPQSRRRK